MKPRVHQLTKINMTVAVTKQQNCVCIFHTEILQWQINEGQSAHYTLSNCKDNDTNIIADKFLLLAIRLMKHELP